MTLKQKGCHGGYSTVDGQMVRDALWSHTDVPVTDDRAARLLCEVHG